MSNNFTKIVRVVAESCYDPPFEKNKGFRFYLLCGLNDRNEIENGDWMGYMKQKGFIFPFLLQNGKNLNYGNVEGLESLHHLESTNLGLKKIVPDEYFNVEADDWAIVFRIHSVHDYGGAGQ